MLLACDPPGSLRSGERGDRRAHRLQRCRKDDNARDGSLARLGLTGHRLAEARLGSITPLSDRKPNWVFGSYIFLNYLNRCREGVGVGPTTRGPYVNSDTNFSVFGEKCNPRI
jgi:hypothetical protein